MSDIKVRLEEFLEKLPRVKQKQDQAVPHRSKLSDAKYEAFLVKLNNEGRLSTVDYEKILERKHKQKHVSI